MSTKAKRAGFCVSVLAGLCLATPALAEGMSASESLKDMMAGNETFQKNEVLGKRRAATAQSQSPQAIIVSCSDSRVPPEAVFNRYLGRLFIVRTAGHAIGDYEFASIEYAVEHLHVPLIVVMGHERCGAIKATVEAVQKAGGGDDEPAGDAHGGGEADDEADADHGHGKKHHRAERGRVSQRDSACAPKKAHGHDDAEDAEDAEDADDEDAGHGKAKGHGKAEKAEKGKKGKKAKAHGKGHGDDEGDEDADDADDADDEDAGHGKAKAHGKGKAKAHGDDEEDADADDEGGHAKPKAKPKAAPAGHGAHEHITTLVKELETPVRVAMKSKPADPVDAAVRVNTKWVAKRLVDESGVVREAVEAGKLKIVSARYDLDTGAVEVLE